VGYLRRLAWSDPRAFSALLGKVLPLQVVGEGDEPLSLQVTFVKPNDPAA
jgi:hypothetical protein